GGYLHDGSDPPGTTWTLTLPPAGTATPQPLRLAQGHPGSSFVCCLMQMGDAPRGPLWDSLPTAIHVAGERRTGPLRHVADTMIEESASPGPASTRLMSRLAEILLILALRRETRDSSGRPGLRALADPLIAPAISLIHADPGHAWSVGSLAAACGMSRSAFAARFTEAVGETPHSYLIRWRMATAAKLLATTDVTVARVATAVGYISEAAFRRAFAGQLGSTPREYRKRHG
ncbi:MAG TPA: AraC family transcriptional regulator, partial [Amycolatopsis sp.]|nr:AraC family transcriptional regulator [Amycolatopsis sp.]